MYKYDNVKLSMYDSVATLEIGSEIYIEGEKIITDTIYLFDRKTKVYTQVYYNNGLKIYKMFKKLPNTGKMRRSDFTSVLVKRLEK